MYSLGTQPWSSPLLILHLADAVFLFHASLPWGMGDHACVSWDHSPCCRDCNGVTVIREGCLLQSSVHKEDKRGAREVSHWTKTEHSAAGCITGEPGPSANDMCGDSSPRDRRCIMASGVQGSRDCGSHLDYIFPLPFSVCYEETASTHSADVGHPILLA